LCENAQRSAFLGILNEKNTEKRKMIAELKKVYFFEKKA